MRMLGHLRGTPAVGLEIGSYEGRSACWLMENVLTSGILYCVDPWDGKDATLGAETIRAEALFDANTRKMQIIKRKGRSVDVVPGLPPVNFAFIDGSHEGCDALLDLLLSWPLVLPGGYLAFDDYQWTDPRLRSSPAAAFDAWVGIRPEGLGEITPVGRLMFVRKDA